MVQLDRRHVLGALATAPLAASPLRAEQPACAPDAEAVRKAADWPELARYAQANQALLQAGTPVDVVFMGDSITQGWPDKRPEFFAPGRICRGIGGQTTPQMVLRMMADVIALGPRQVHIMGGTNDLAGNTGPITPAQTLDNLAAMVLLAKAHRIKVLLGSIPPAANFPWRPGLETARAIAALNGQIAELAARLKVRFVDYTAVLADGAGGMKPGLAYDGVHPDTAGYAAMESVLAPLLKPRRHG